MLGVYLTTTGDAVHSLFSGLIGALVQMFLAVRASRLFGRRKLVKRLFLAAISVVVL